MLGRGAICAILIYVALDLSLPMMPGAFVFEPGDSVESAQPTHGRKAVAIPVVAEPIRVTVSIRAPSEIRPRSAAPRNIWSRGRAMARSAPQSTAAPATSAEDPH